LQYPGFCVTGQAVAVFVLLKQATGIAKSFHQVNKVQTCPVLFAGDVKMAENRAKVEFHIVIT